MEPMFRETAVNELTAIPLGILLKLYASPRFTSDSFRVFSVFGHKKPFGLTKVQLERGFDELGELGFIEASTVDGVKEARVSRTVKLLDARAQAEFALRKFEGEAN